jgi:hypothetical protein
MHEFCNDFVNKNNFFYKNQFLLFKLMNSYHNCDHFLCEKFLKIIIFFIVSEINLMKSKLHFENFLFFPLFEG